MPAPAARGRPLIHRAYWLPGSPVRERLERFEGIELAVPDLAPGEISRIFSDLRQAGGRLRRCPRKERCAALADAARRFLEPGELRRRAIEGCAATTGLSRAVVARGLDGLFGEIRAEVLEDIVAGAGQVHDFLAVVGAGNVPGVALPKAALALAAGTPCFVKTASGEPLLAALFAAALNDANEALGSAFGVAWWRGGDRRWEEPLARSADSLVAYGSDVAVEALGRSAPGEFLGHGERTSAAIVRLEGGGADEAAAAAAALDVAMFDQLGCLSPRAVWAIGPRPERHRFAAALAAELERLAEALPRGRVPAEASAAIRRLRDEFEWRELAGEAVRSFASARGTEWTVLLESSPGFRPSPLYRTVFVLPLERPLDLAEALGEARGRVECLGILPDPDPELEAAAAAAGVPNVVPLGRMHRPTLRWRQGGFDTLSGIVRTRGRRPQ